MCHIFDGPDGTALRTWKNETKFVEMGRSGGVLKGYHLCAGCMEGDTHDMLAELLED